MDFSKIPKNAKIINLEGQPEQVRIALVQALEGIPEAAETKADYFVMCAAMSPKAATATGGEFLFSIQPVDEDDTFACRGTVRLLGAMCQETAERLLHVAKENGMDVAKVEKMLEPYYAASDLLHKELMTFATEFNKLAEKTAETRPWEHN